ncbi:PepSY-like domain-containing protein [Myroides sp. LJL115]
MKISYMLLCSLFATTVVFTSCNQTKNQQETTQLQQNSESFLQGVFPGMLITNSTAIHEKSFKGSVISATLDNNISVDFDKQGNWTEVKSKDHTPISATFLEQQLPVISNYLKEHYPDNFVVEVEKINNQGYEVELNSQFELVFDQDQKFIGIDLDYDDNEQLVDFNEFPDPAKQFIAKEFPDSKIVLAKAEKDGKKTTLKAYLSQGFKVQFNKDGQWKEISGSFASPIPSSILLQNIQTYLTTNYKDYVITGIELDQKDKEYQVELETLTDEKDLIFSLEGNFIKID